VVVDLFHAYRDDPRAMDTTAPAASSSTRTIADYIAGMTDRFAIREHARLTGQQVFEFALS